MLILFDIDGTLLLSKRAGMNAMTDAGHELFGEAFSFEGVDFAGRLDPTIWSMAARKNAVADTPENHERFRAAYARLLKARFDADPTAELLPGVAELLERLRQDSLFTVGLLTGNYPETGKLKLRTAGLDPDIFTICAWGDEAAQRRDLPGVAMARYEQAVGEAIRPEQVVVIGDTPHDVDCALHHGCRALAVATGPVHSFDELLAHEPDLAVRDLSDTESVMGWLLDRRSVSP
ncbi:MAG: HAD hydrolase-like protein [Phycisphaerales bacterium]|nr:MAG: HAD hydrolase-like protein [Phycisphaerales bacterium]